MKKRGRPKTSTLSRSEQLREAKRRQRKRERDVGLITVEMKLCRALAQKLTAAQRTPGFANQLESFLDTVVVRITDFPLLSDLAWNRATPIISARDAFGIYERNYRFVDSSNLEPHEAALLHRLTECFGNGVINA